MVKIARARLVGLEPRRRAALALIALGAAACGPTGTAAPPVDDRDVATSDGPGIGSDADASSEAVRGSDASSDTATERPPLARPSPAAVFVHLFEWKWTDIAIECEKYLGPAGFTAVQVSPPSEHVVLPSHPWWQRYQTVSYSLAKSRSGTGDEFRDMVQRCADAGVSIYVDAVINHMTGQASGVGSNGTAFTKYDYPGLYTPADFRMPPCTIAGSDYQNAPDRVQNCELVGLSDLNTSNEHVRGQIANYLASLVRIGVRGFRIDAAKHIAQADLDGILRVVGRLVSPSDLPYYFFEVIDYGGEAIHAADYLPTADGTGQEVDLTEFKFGGIGEFFLNAQGKKLADLKTLSETGWNLLPSDRAVVFVDNHDTERGSAIFYQNAPYYDLAVAFMLAWPYGYPSILSGFAFDRSTAAGRDLGPPSDAMGNTQSVYPPGFDDGGVALRAPPAIGRRDGLVPPSHGVIAGGDELLG
jgi:alpha-amylase